MDFSRMKESDPFINLTVTRNVICDLKDGKYLLNPDYYAALLFSKTMKGNVIKVNNSLDSTVHQYGTIRKHKNGDIKGITLLILNYRDQTLFIQDTFADKYSKLITRPISVTTSKLLEKHLRF